MAKYDLLFMALLDLWYHNPDLLPFQADHDYFMRIFQILQEKCRLELTYQIVRKKTEELIGKIENLDRPGNWIQNDDIEFYGKVLMHYHERKNLLPQIRNISSLKGFDARFHYKVRSPNENNMLHTMSYKSLMCKDGLIQPKLLINFGTFGAVYLCSRRDELTAYAVKLYKVQNRSTCKEQEMTQMLLRAARTVSNPNICTIVSCDVVQYGGVNVGMIVMQPYHLSLHHITDYSIAFTPPQLTLVMTQVGNGLEYLHSMGIVHGDLKPTNIMLKVGEVKTLGDTQELTTFTCILVDFGNSFMGKTVGPLLQSAPYRAPEVLAHQEVSYPIDIWSLGIIGLQLLEPHFLYVNYELTVETIAAHLCLYRLTIQEIPDKYIESPELTALVEAMLEEAKRENHTDTIVELLFPSHRLPKIITVDKLFSEKARPMEQYYGYRFLLQQMLIIDSTTRFTASHVAKYAF